jgi:hypothetical protein
MIELDEVGKRAFQELGHALDALGDGSGCDVWGPGPVGQRLWGRNSHAAVAFDRAAQLAVDLTWGIGSETFDAPRIIRAMRELAPAILLLVLEQSARSATGG